VEELVASGEKVSLATSAKMIGARWSALSEDDKRPWLDRAAADKQRYDSEMQQVSMLSFKGSPRNRMLFEKRWKL